jgi:hypothetical protein
MNIYQGSLYYISKSRHQVVRGDGPLKVASSPEDAMRFSADHGESIQMTRLNSCDQRVSGAFQHPSRCCGDPNFCLFSIYNYAQALESLFREKLIYY